jgi:predicted MFS family arabinose efflux permease
LGWAHQQVAGFLALWVIGYGVVQALAPLLTGTRSGGSPDGRHVVGWAALLAILPALLAWQLQESVVAPIGTGPLVVAGLLLFGAVFAVNSSLHSYLIISYAQRDAVSLDVGFYYMANAMGRLLGTVLSGWLYQDYGLVTCLWVSAGFVLLAAVLSSGLPRYSDNAAQSVR